MTLDILDELDSLVKIYDNPIKCAARDAAIEIRRLRGEIAANVELTRRPLLGGRVERRVRLGDELRQLELCDDADFGAENVFEIPPELWTIKTKTKEAIKNCMCAVCGKKPKTTDPLPAGWYWDSMEPNNNWVWCDEHNFDDA